MSLTVCRPFFRAERAEIAEVLGHLVAFSAVGWRPRIDIDVVAARHQGTVTAYWWRTTGVRDR